MTIYITDKPVTGGRRIDRAQIGHVLFHADKNDTKIFVKHEDLAPLFLKKGIWLSQMFAPVENDIVYFGAVSDRGLRVSWSKIIF